VDVYAHMRRDGPNVTDSLWLFTGVSTVGTSGTRYFDIELYKKNFGYNSISGTFTTAGTDAGHTQWLFDAAGNIIQTGDLILAVTYSPGSAPVVDVRIWVSSTTFTTINPAFFNFGPVLDGATAAFGYTSITSNSGSTAFGSGIANFSATPAQDTTYSTPWGTEMSSKSWGTQYQTLQLVEIGLNLTRIGLDPALYKAFGLSPCQNMFSDIFFKSRSSASFVSNMQDFVAPLTFLQQPLMDFGVQADTLRCNRPVGTIQITNNSTIGFYTWKTLSGNISGSNSDSTQININKPGTYIVAGSPSVGCPPTRYDTVVIPIDTFPPEATINAGIGSNFSYLQLYGGDTAASDYLTPFGRSKGLLWNWSGPNGFTSTIQNPQTDTAWGTYELIVTEKRNGCTDTAYQPLDRSMFGVLAARSLNLQGNYVNGTVALRWQDIGLDDVDHFEIDRSADGESFTSIGDLPNNRAADSVLYFYSYIDKSPLNGNNFYRLKVVGRNGNIYYSTIILVKVDLSSRNIYVAGTSHTGYVLVCNADKSYSGTIVLYNLVGERLATRAVQLSKGQNQVQVPVTASMKNSITVLVLYLDENLSFSQEMLP
jgi:hypothetical protein